MPTALRSTLIQFLTLAGCALLAAVLSNAVATPTRRLFWKPVVRALPPLAPPLLKEREPEAPITAPTPVVPAETRKAVPSPSAWTKPGPSVTSPTATVAEPPPSVPIREITAGEAWKAFQAGTPFLDARRSAEYADGHVAGAWSTPVWEADVDDRLLSFKAARRPGADDPIVIYCSGGDCRDSHLLATKLLNEGYFHLLIFRDGYPAWVAQGHPIEKGQP